MLHRLAATLGFLSVAGALGGAVFVSCAQDAATTSSSGAAECPPPTTTTAVSTSPPGVEWTGFHVEVPLDSVADFDKLASGLFGAGAQNGQFVKNQVLSPGIFVTGSQDPSTPQQTRLTFAFDDGTNPSRDVAVAPASFAMGGVYISTVDVAMATMTSEEAASPGSSESWFLEYRVSSALGGKLSFGVRGVLGVYTLVIDVNGPHTGLTTSTIGKPADSFKAYDTVAGTVWFHLTKDDFDFFVTHAYGQGAETQQNFNNFQLLPHTWLRLTVTPHLQQQFVDVGFVVVTTDNKTINVAKAPASTLAGSTFQAMVDRNMTTMLAQEATKAGSSTPWSAPFYYQDPSGGGVVQVIASGATGSFEVAYAIETPQHPLTDVPFVAYEPVTFVPPDAAATASCQNLGNPNIKLAPNGTLDITFAVSNVILNSPNLKGPLVGDVYCSVYNASDVNVGGPLPNAKSLQDFTLPMANLEAKPPPTFTTKTFYAGDYQVLCFQDLKGTGTVAQYDPVTLPIGSYSVACNENPITVEFALLDPDM